MKKILTIDGMTCKHCSNRVVGALEELDGVKSAKVSLRKKTATVKLDREVADSVFKEIIEDVGYDLIDIK